MTNTKQQAVNTGYSNLLVAIVDSARNDILNDPPDIRKNTVENNTFKNTAKEFFEQHPHLGPLPKGYVKLADLAKQTGLKYDDALKLIHQHNCLTLTLGFTILVNEASIIRAARRKGTNEL